MSKRRKVINFVWDINSPLRYILSYCDFKTLVKLMIISKDVYQGVEREIVDLRKFKKGDFGDLKKTFLFHLNHLKVKIVDIFISKNVVDLICKNQSLTFMMKTILFQYSFVRNYKIIFNNLEKDIIHYIVKENGANGDIFFFFVFLLIYARKSNNGIEYLKCFINKLKSKNCLEENIETYLFGSCFQFLTNTEQVSYLKFWGDLKRNQLKDLFK